MAMIEDCCFQAKYDELRHGGRPVDRHGDSCSPGGQETELTLLWYKWKALTMFTHCDYTIIVGK